MFLTSVGTLWSEARAELTPAGTSSPTDGRKALAGLVNSRDPLVIATCEPCSTQGTQAPLLANVRG